jgi:hypothetical protein
MLLRLNTNILVVSSVGIRVISLTVGQQVLVVLSNVVDFVLHAVFQLPELVEVEHQYTRCDGDQEEAKRSDHPGNPQTYHTPHCVCAEG